VHLGRSRALLRSALRWLRPRADALALLGDLTQAATPEDYRYLLDELNATGLPSYLIPGNHDLPHGAPSAGGDSPLSRAVSGARHPNVITPDLAGAQHPPAIIASAQLQPDLGGYRVTGIEHLPPARSPATPLVWLTHFPAISHQAAAAANGWRYAGDLANRADIQQRLHQYRAPVIVLAGHLHLRAHAIAGNILQLSHAALAESPHDASIITITAADSRLEVRRRAHRVAIIDDDRPTVIDPPHTRFRWAADRWLAG
jgi:hypothetical protein